jgi:hypothetical protein
MQNVEQTIISQYGNSPVILALINDANAYIDPAADIQNFFDNVWNIETAQGFGLDILGEIAGVTRAITINSPANAATVPPFGPAPLTPGLTPNSYLLTDEAFKPVILTKALSNISDCSAGSYNRRLANLFSGRGPCYVVDLGRMAYMYGFGFYVYPYELAILSQSGAFPRPSGVELNGYLTPSVPAPMFGWDAPIAATGTILGTFKLGTTPLGNFGGAGLVGWDMGAWATLNPPSN